MLSKLLIAFLLMALCVAIHATGLTSAFRWMHVRLGRCTRHFWHAPWMLVRIAAWTLGLHLIEILVWALFYTWRGAMPDLTTAAYFSAVTYTTIGYGDLVLPPEWRLVGGVEALTGILMCGLSTGLFFAVFTEVFGINRRTPRQTP
jgi:Ion channel